MGLKTAEILLVREISRAGGGVDGQRDKRCGRSEIRGVDGQRDKRCGRSEIRGVDGQRDKRCGRSER